MLIPDVLGGLHSILKPTAIYDFLFSFASIGPPVSHGSRSEKSVSSAKPSGYRPQRRRYLSTSGPARQSADNGSVSGAMYDPLALLLELEPFAWFSVSPVEDKHYAVHVRNEHRRGSSQHRDVHFDPTVVKD